MKYFKFYQYLFPYWKKEVLILVLGSLSLLLSLVNPYLTKLVIDKAYANRDLKLFVILVTIGGIIFVLNGALNALSNYLNKYIRLKINFNLNQKLFKKLQQLSYSFFQDRSSAEHLFKINYDVEQVSRFIADVLPSAVTLIPKSIFILFIIFYLDTKMALSALLLMPLLYIVPYYFTKKLKTAWKAWIENSQGIFKELSEVLTHIQLVKAFGKEKAHFKKYLNKLVENVRLSLKNTRLEAAGAFANSLASRIILGLIVFYGGYQVIKGNITLGTLSALSIYLTQLSGLQGSFAQFFQQISLGLVSCERLEAIFNAQSELREDKEAREITFSSGRMEFNNVSFGYKKDRLILNGINFSIPGNAKIALIGLSGCGKTTILSLILRLYEQEKGAILIDGMDTRKIKLGSLKSQIGVALQEPFLWNDTVKNNILYPAKAPTEEEVIRVAKLSEAHNFIADLPNGYDSLAGEMATKLSEGQKQRIALARALIKRPKILILDEALSSVDSETEEKIIENILREFKNSTLIIVSHRLSAIRKMDLVYFLENNSTIKIGSHKWHLENNPRYRELFAGQIEEFSKNGIRA